MENNFKKENLYIAELKWFEKGEGVEFDSPLSYVILNKIDENNYYNVFDITENLPVFERSRCYSNCTNDGLEYGTKMIYKSGILETGPCFVINSEFPLDKDEFNEEELKDFVINDERYFKDRKDFAASKIKNPFKLYKLVSEDNKKYDYMNYYIEERTLQKVKKI